MEIKRGGIYYIKNTNAIGHEMMKSRPAVIVSCDPLNYTGHVARVRSSVLPAVPWAASPGLARGFPPVPGPLYFPQPSPIVIKRALSIISISASEQRPSSLPTRELSTV